MGVLGWIALGMAAALLANMALRQKITDASFSGLICLAGAAVLPLACHLHTRPSGRPGGSTRRRDVQEGSP